MKSFIETFTGGTFDPLNPVFADIRIEDIAHALSRQCRFSGHTRFHYSVAEHSVRVAECVRERTFSLGQRSCSQLMLWGLLHDASEAYLIDMPSPVKSAEGSAVGAEYRKIEAVLMAAVCKRFGLPAKEPAVVRKADGILLSTEVRDLMHGDRAYWSKLQYPALMERIRPWGADVAKYEFLRLYRNLSGDERP